MARSIRRYVVSYEDEETVLHLSGPVLEVKEHGSSAVIYALHDDTIQEKIFILRIFETGEIIPYHFDFVATLTFGSTDYHLCSYSEDDEAWTPALMSDAVAPSAAISEPSNS